jgi:hypothetical protein
LESAPSTVENEPGSKTGKSKSFHRQNTTPILLSALALAFMLGWFYSVKRGSPGRVMDMPQQGDVIGIRDGLLYLHESPNVWAIDVQSQSSKKLFWNYSKDAPQHDARGFTQLTLEPQVILLRASHDMPGQARPASGVGVLAGMDAGRLVVHGGNTSPAGKAQTKYVTSSISTADMGSAVAVREPNKEYALLSKSYGPENAKPELANYSGADTARVGANLYWIERWKWTNIPEKLTPHMEGNTHLSFAYPPCSRLMVSTSDGTVRFTGILLDSEIKGGSDRVYWRVRGDKPSSTTLYSLKPGEQTPTEIPGYEGISLPVECAENLYWLESKAAPSSPYERPTIEYTIKSTSIQNWLPKTILTWTTKRPELQPDMQYPSPFVVNRRRLYFTPVEGVGPETDGAVESHQRVIYEMAPENPTVMKSVCILPRGSGFIGIDGNYCYYSTSETREKWWDWSKEGLTQKDVRVIFRRSLTQ